MGSIENQKLKANFRNNFRILDILMFLIIVCNLGALLITNIMVMQKPNIKIVEANPVAGKIHNLETTPNWFSFIKPFLINASLLGLLLGHYVWGRNTATRIKDIKVLTYIYCFVAVFFIYDFINNLGYLIGGII